MWCMRDSSREAVMVEIDNIRYVNVGRLRQADGLAVYYPLGLSVPSSWSACY